MTIEQMIARQQELLNAARSAGRNMTREEAAEFDSLQRSIDAARAAGAGIAHGGQSSTPAAGEGGNGGQDPQNAQRAIEAERQRIRSIEDLCTEFGLEARSYIDNGSTEEQVRAAVLEHLRSQHSPVATGIQATDTQEDKFRRAAADSLGQDHGRRSGAFWCGRRGKHDDRACHATLRNAFVRAERTDGDLVARDDSRECAVHYRVTDRTAPADPVSATRAVASPVHGVRHHVEHMRACDIVLRLSQARLFRGSITCRQAPTSA